MDRKLAGPLIRRLRRDLRAEVGAAEIYLQQARRARSAELRGGLEEIAAEERRHGEFLMQVFRESGVHPGRCLPLQRLGGKMAGFTISLLGIPVALRFDLRFERLNARWYEEEASTFAAAGDGVKALRFEAMARGEEEHSRKLARWCEAGLR